MTITIPSSPADRQKLKNAMNELDNAMTRVAAERDFIKDTISTLSEDLEIPKTVIRKAATAYHKRDMTNLEVEFEDIKTLYETATEL